MMAGDKRRHPHARKILALAEEDKADEIEELLSATSGNENKELLLESCNENKETALWRACKKGNVESAAVLLKHGANANVQSKFLESPAYIAAQFGRRSCLELLLRCDADFLTLRDLRGELPVHVATYHGKMRCAELLLEAGTPVNIQDKDGRTAAYVASYHDHVEILEMLIRHGADLNIPRNNGRTPLYCAAAEGNPFCLRMLIAFGADVNLRDKQQRTALTASTVGNSGEDRGEIKAILRAAGAEF